MPCDQSRTVTVNLEVADRQILLEGLKADGFETSVYDNGDINIYSASGYIGTLTTSGKLQFTSYLNAEDQERQSVQRTNMIRRAYSRGVVERTAKKYNWKLKATEPDVKTSSMKWQVQKNK